MLHTARLVARPVPHFAMIAGLMLSVTLPGGARAPDTADARFSLDASASIGATAPVAGPVFVKHSRPSLQAAWYALANERAKPARPTTSHLAADPPQLTAVWRVPVASAPLRASPPAL